MRGDGLGHSLGGHQAVAIHREVSNPAALAFQPTADFRYRRMFDDRGDDVIALAAVGGGYAFDSVVVGLGAAAGKNQGVRRAAQEGGGLLPGLVNGGPGGQAEGVAAGGIAKVVVEVGQHSRRYLGVKGRGGIIVQINGVHSRAPASGGGGVSGKFWGVL